MSFICEMLILLGFNAYPLVIFRYSEASMCNSLCNHGLLFLELLSQLQIGRFFHSSQETETTL